MQHSSPIHERKNRIRTPTNTTSLYLGDLSCTGNTQLKTGLSMTVLVKRPYVGGADSRFGCLTVCVEAAANTSPGLTVRVIHSPFWNTLVWRAIFAAHDVRAAELPGKYLQAVPALLRKNFSLETWRILRWQWLYKSRLFKDQTLSCI